MVFRTIVFIFIVISTTFRPICLMAFFRCLSNSGIYMERRTTFFIESTGVVCYDSVCHIREQALNILILLLACSQDWTCNLQMIVSLEAYNKLPANHRAKIKVKEKGKLITWSLLENLKKKLWNMKLTVIPVLSSTLGSVVKRLILPGRVRNRTTNCDHPNCSIV